MPSLGPGLRLPLWLRKAFLALSFCLAVVVLVIVSLAFLAACRGPRL